MSQLERASSSAGPTTRLGLGNALELGIPFAIAALLVAAVLASGWPVNHDIASYLQIGQLLVAGAIPYVDYVELNPPLIQYLHTLPVALSMGTGLGLPASFGVLVSALCLYSAWAIGTQLLGSGLLDRAQCTLIAAGWLCLSIAVLCNNGFGQREHLFVLAFAPWLVLRFARHRELPISPWRSWTLGVLIALSALLKPHLLLILAMGELWMLLRSRRLRALAAPEVIVLVALGLLYGAHFWLMPEAMRAQFFGRWVPLIAANYDSYDTPLSEILRSDIGIAVGIATLFSVAVTPLLRRQNELAVLVEAFCLTAVLGACVFFVQHKGWYYHAYPCLAGAGLLLLAGVATGSRELSGARGRDLTRVALLSVAAIALFFTGFAFHNAPRVQAQARFMAVAIARDTQPGDRVAFIDTSVGPGSTAMLYSGRLPAIRFLPAFPIAFFSQQRARANPGGAFDYPSDSEWSNEERRVLEEIGSDLSEQHPPLVLIRAADCLACPPDFSIDEYLRRSGWSARHLASYHKLADSGGYAVYGRNREPR